MAVELGADAWAGGALGRWSRGLDEHVQAVAVERILAALASMGTSWPWPGSVASSWARMPGPVVLAVAVELIRAGGRGRGALGRWPGWARPGRSRPVAQLAAVLLVAGGPRWPR